MSLTFGLLADDNGLITDKVITTSAEERPYHPDSPRQTVPWRMADSAITTWQQ
ncbi:hypothetical protein [Carnimonas bestiolae]|uniref:hypothetical protein n=1 Tax=Carnimonas bestiolae TaxID=3402172 RepID=UPI003F4A8641